MARMFSLTPRLQLVADMVGNEAKIVDVGTDHAYLPVWLVYNGFIDLAIATDINEAPLKKASSNVEKYGLTERIRLILCDGLSGVDKSDADTIIIAGMGADTMISILTAAPWAKGKTLLLQPMTNSTKLRRFLRENGYVILDEALACEDRRLYSVMRVSAGEAESLEAYDYISRPLIERGGSEVSRYLKKEISNQENVLAGMKATSSQDTEHQIRLIEQLNEILEFQIIQI